MTSSPAALDRYLALIKKSLLNELYPELEAIVHYILRSRREGVEPVPAAIRDMAGHRPDILDAIAAARADGSMIYWPNPDGSLHDPRNVTEHVHTMIGRKRLDHLHWCLDRVLEDGIAGDLIETGVWRGGSTVFMRAHLAAHGVTDRCVWVADSFAGLPKPSVAEDAGYDISAEKEPILAVSLERVQDLFRRYDLLDDQVRFLKGWFRDTLPTAPIDQLALLRLDGDLYESTMDALSALYDKVARGGFVVVDDYGALPPCRKAVEDFRASRAISAPLEIIDWTGAFWRKT
jgi:O-methyltransferase